MKIKVKVQHQSKHAEQAITELELHAFVDGQLADEERARVLEAAQHSASIRARLDELDQLKSLMQLGYADIKYLH